MAAISGTFAAAGSSAVFTPTESVTDVIVSRRAGEVHFTVGEVNTAPVTALGFHEAIVTPTLNTAFAVQGTTFYGGVDNISLRLQ